LPGGDELFINSTMLPLTAAIANATAPAADTGELDDPAEEATETPAQEAVEDQGDVAPNPPIMPTAGPIKDDDGQPGPKVPPQLVQDIYSGTQVGVDYGYLRAACRPVVRDAISRIMRKEAKATAHNLSWLDRHEGEHRQYITENLTPLETVMKAAGVELNIGGYVERHLSLSRTQVEAVRAGRATIQELESDWCGDRVDAVTTALLEGHV
jgi:hypothetical protein